jgi:hypothetical protein
MTVKTYGQLDYAAVGVAAGVRMYRVRAVPHVAQQAKRMFPRCDQSVPGVILMRDTPAVARDLEWFMQRWPLRADPGVLAHLAAEADQHRQTEETVQAILDGYLPPDGWREAALAPRGYQLAADAIVHATGRLLLADDLGLGKSLSAALRLRDPAALPALVVAPAHLCGQWQRELAKFLPWLTSHVVRKGKPYDPAGPRGGSSQPDVWIMSYFKLGGWADHLAGDIKTVIFDEIHDLRTGQGTVKWAAAAQIAWKALYRTGASATPIFNYGDEIWNLYEVLAPGELGSREEFIREWCGGERGMGGHHLVRDPAMLGGYLRDAGLLLVRTRRELHMEMPDPIQVEQDVDTDHATIDEVAAQCAAQARILTGEIPADFTARGQAYREIDWKMRQATGVAKARYVAEFVRLLLASEERVVVWAWHRRCYEILLDKLSDFAPVLYSGSETPAQKERSRAAFCGGGSRVMLMSLRSGVGLDGLQEWCSVGVFAELDWSPEQHAQCVGRLARDGQDDTVVVYFMTSDAGTDPLMCEVLGIKKQQSVPIRDPGAPLFETLTDPTERGRQLAATVLARVSARKGAA